MKSILLISIGALGLAACGKDEPPAEPASAISAPAAAPATQMPSQTAATPEQPSSTSATGKPAVRAASAAARQTYVVEKGDTLYGIASSRDVTAADLARWNDISDPRRMRVGQELRLTAP